MQNWGVLGSLSCALFANTDLHALVICHSNESKYLDIRTRISVYKLCCIFSSLISAPDTEKKTKQKHERQEAFLSFANLVKTPRWTADRINEIFSNIMKTVDSCGVAYSISGHANAYGDVPADDRLHAIVKALTEQKDHKSYQTNNLDFDLGLKHQEGENICGLLAYPIPKTPSDDYIIWFRKEYTFEKNWAGEPSKEIQKDKGNFKILPRQSFDVWKQISSRSSKEWSPEEENFVRSLGLLSIAMSQAFLSQERFDLAVAGSASGLWDWDKKTGDLFWSDRFMEMVGVQPEDFSGKLEEFTERLHPEDKDTVIKALDDHFKFKTPYNIDYRLRREDGSYIWIHAKGQGLWNEAGEPIRMAGSVDDISADKEKEIELYKYKEQTEVFLQAIEACQIGISLISLSEDDMPLSFVNKKFEEITGYKRDEIVGTNCRFLQGEDTDPEHVRILREGIQSESQVSTELLNYRKNGEAFWNNIQVSPVYGIDGKLATFVGTQMDITDLKNAHERLQKERDLTRHIIDFSANLVIGLDPDGKVNFINKAALSLLGLENDSIIGKDLASITDHGNQKTIKSLLDNLTDGENDNIEMRMTDDSGLDHNIIWAPVKRYDDNEKLAQIILTGTDLTEERARSEAERKRKNLESLGTMAGGLAHEINNALQPIVLLSEYSQSILKEDDVKLQKNLKTILDYAIYARSILNDILLYSRKEKRIIKTHNIIEILSQGLSMAGDILPQAIQIVQNIDDNLSHHCIDVNDTGFFQVLNNLLKNASDAMHGEGEIRITASHITLFNNPENLNEGAYLEILIADKGDGIPKNKIHKIFDPFFTTKTQGEGTGIGLSVVYGMLQEWGGDISVESEEGNGATFRLLLPISSA